MSRINATPRVPKSDPALERVLREHALQINQLSEGRISAAYSALSSVPTGGMWAQGDFVRNATPTELGSTGSKYVVHGWQCVVGGAPGTWVQCRFLTGN